MAHSSDNAARHRATPFISAVILTFKRRAFIALGRASALPVFIVTSLKHARNMVEQPGGLPCFSEEPYGVSFALFFQRLKRGERQLQRLMCRDSLRRGADVDMRAGGRSGDRPANCDERDAL